MAGGPLGKLDPTAGPTGTFTADATPHLERAPWYHSGPSSILKDGVQYVHRGKP